MSEPQNGPGLSPPTSFLVDNSIVVGRESVRVATHQITNVPPDTPPLSILDDDVALSRRVAPQIGHASASVANVARVRPVVCRRPLLFRRRARWREIVLAGFVVVRRARVIQRNFLGPRVSIDEPLCG